MKFLYCLYHSVTAFVNIFSSDFAIENPIESSSCPASVSGWRGSFLLTICSWWNWQICTGTSLKTLGIKQLPAGPRWFLWFGIVSTPPPNGLEVWAHEPQAVSLRQGETRQKR